MKRITVEINYKEDIPYRSARYIGTISPQQHEYFKRTFPGRFRYRGRHPHRKYIAEAFGFKLNYCGDIPIRYAHTIALYLK